MVIFHGYVSHNQMVPENFFEPAGPAKGLDSFEVSRRPNWAAMTAFAFFKVFGGM